MKTVFDKSAGFTIIEMLAVIAIIAMLATVTVSAIGSAQRHARNAKCQANLHSLHQATMAFVSDAGGYPAASSYEWYEIRPDGIRRRESRGWVTWVAEGKDCRRFGEDAIYSYDDNYFRGQGFVYGDSKAKSFKYVGIYDKTALVKQSISEGAIFKYTGKNYAVYYCPDCAFTGGTGKKHVDVVRSYAMNEFFGRAGKKGEKHGGNSGLKSGLGASVAASRLAMYVEMGDVGNGKSCSGVSGCSTDDEPDGVYYDDSAWSYDEDPVSGDKIGFWHGKKKHGTTNVMFADGHLEAVDSATMKKSDFREKIGKGKEE